MRLPRLPSLAALREMAWRQTCAQADRWFLWTPVAFGGGCGVYFGLLSEPPLWVGGLAVALALGLAALVRARALPRGANQRG